MVYISPFRLRRRQHRPRIDEGALVVQLKVQVRARRVAGAAGKANQAALEHALAADDVPLAQVAIDALPAVAVVDDHQVAEAKAVGAGVDDDAAVGGIDWVAQVSANIDA